MTGEYSRFARTPRRRCEYLRAENLRWLLSARPPWLLSHRGSERSERDDRASPRDRRCPASPRPCSADHERSYHAHTLMNFSPPPHLTTSSTGTVALTCICGSSAVEVRAAHERSSTPSLPKGYALTPWVSRS